MSLLTTAVKSGDLAALRQALPVVPEGQPLSQEVFDDLFNALALKVQRGPMDEGVSELLRATGFTGQQPLSFPQHQITEKLLHLMGIVVMTGETSIVTALLPLVDFKASNAYGGHGLLMQAAKWHHDDEMIQILLDAGADPKASFKNLDETALGVAANSGNAKAFNLLLPLSDARATHDGGLTMLMLAAMGGNPDIIKALAPLSDLNAVTDDGYSALHVAAMSGSESLKSLLPFYTTQGTVVDHPQGAQPTVLMLAALSGDLEAVQVALPFSHPNQVDEIYEMTALMMAVAEPSLGKHDSAIVELLVPLTDVTIRDRFGKTALDLAEHRNQTWASDRHAKFSNPGSLSQGAMDDLRSATEAAMKASAVTLSDEAQELEAVEPSPVRPTRRARRWASL